MGGGEQRSSAPRNRSIHRSVASSMARLERHRGRAGRGGVTERGGYEIDVRGGRGAVQWRPLQEIREACRCTEDTGREREGRGGEELQKRFAYHLCTSLNVVSMVENAALSVHTNRPSPSYTQHPIKVIHHSNRESPEYDGQGMDVGVRRMVHVARVGEQRRSVFCQN